MKRILYTIAILLSMALAGCGNDTRDYSGMDYTVTITLDNSLHHDSATLLVLEEEYDKLRQCGKAELKNGTFTFTGQTDKPKVALICWDNDSTQPFHFVLESGETLITLKPNAWSAKGSKQNADYLEYVNWRNGIIDARVATWQEYLNMAADSSLTREDEVRMARQDSLLNDSLQRVTVERINRKDAVGRIIRERYGKQLDQAHKRMLE